MRGRGREGREVGDRDNTSAAGRESILVLHCRLRILT